MSTYIGDDNESITIPEGVTKVNSYAFEYRNLLSITFPSSLTTIGSDMFIGGSIGSLTFLSSVPPSFGSNFFVYLRNAPIYVLSASLDTYKSTWTSYANNIYAIPA